MALVHLWVHGRKANTIARLRALCNEKWAGETLVALHPKYFGPGEMPVTNAKGEQTSPERVVGVATTSDRVDIIQAYAEIGIPAVTCEDLDGPLYPKPAPEPAPRNLSGGDVDLATVNALLEKSPAEIREVVAVVEEKPFLSSLLAHEQAGQNRDDVVRVVEARLAGEELPVVASSGGEGGAGGEGGEVPPGVTDAAREAAEAMEVDLAEVTGTGAGGKITKADVVRFGEARAQASGGEGGAGGEEAEGAESEGEAPPGTDGGGSISDPGEGEAPPAA